MLRTSTDNEIPIYLEKVRFSSLHASALIKLVAVIGSLHLRKRGRKRICERFGITIQRTVQELNGKAWLELDEETPMARQVMSSLSFGERVESLVQQREAISYHAANSDGLAGVAAVRQSTV